ncbi:MAG: acyl-[acyl-carrier-protein]--UDP-N-acetylglucosamine O-acyltransferase [Deltaproteobacteria bacterium]|nr:MAG: acyl-[acyl-carrier-protein]--UDP-N-acetylglucosamine O-acyltransferase [Deltaproteobacteria bacterium]
MVDSRAVVDEKARIHPSVKIAPYAVIGPDVELKAGVTVGAHAVIDGHTTIGEDARIFPHAAVGFQPQDLKYKGEPTTLEVGARTMVREFATLHTGTEGGGGVTKVGSDCLVMAYAHVAHDCMVGNGVILANAATLAGHVTLEDHVIVGGLTGIHQFVRVGEHAIVGGGAVVLMDIPPYVTAGRNPARLAGLNLIGLKRRGFDRAKIKAIRTAYRTLFQSKDNLSTAVKNLMEMEEYGIDAVKYMVSFIESSERGVTRI